MPNWFKQLFGRCFDFGRNNRRNETDWGSTPSLTSTSPSTHCSAEPIDVPFDPFGSNGHRHLGYLDCHRVECQLGHLYPNIQQDSELLELAHRPRATLVKPVDLIQDLAAWGYSVSAAPDTARQRARHECGHKETDIIPSLVQGEYLCIACIDQETAADGRYSEAHLKFTPLGVPSDLALSEAAGRR